MGGGSTGGALVHDRVPAGHIGRFKPWFGVQNGALQHGGHRELQVLPGQRGQQVLVRDDLALLGDLDGAIEGAARLSEDRVVGWATAAADRAAAAMEKPKPY